MTRFFVSAIYGLVLAMVGFNLLTWQFWVLLGLYLCYGLSIYFDVLEG